MDDGERRTKVKPYFVFVSINKKGSRSCLCTRRVISSAPRVGLGLRGLRAARDGFVFAANFWTELLDAAGSTRRFVHGVNEWESTTYRA